MNRVGDYCGFAVRFVGFGYAGLWPLAAAGHLASPSGICRPDASSSALSLCHWVHAPSLPPGLHLIGGLCVVIVAVRLAVRGCTRWRRARANRAGILASRLPAVVRPPTNKWPKSRPLPTVKPRRNFGLRGMPR